MCLRDHVWVRGGCIPMRTGRWVGGLSSQWAASQYQPMLSVLWASPHSVCPTTLWDSNSFVHPTDISERLL